jgi:hypothetical protein
MGRPGRRAWACLLALLAVPVTFFGIGCCWHLYDLHLGKREVSRFILENQGLVAKWMANAKVHSFQLGPEPDKPWSLRISYDVDDKATFLALEEDLFKRTVMMRFPPRWETNLRSKEELGFSPGFAAWGLAELGKAFDRLFYLAVASLLLPGLALFIALRRLRKNAV